jgi:hypothetical protein
MATPADEEMNRTWCGMVLPTQVLVTNVIKGSDEYKELDSACARDATSAVTDLHRVSAASAGGDIE